MLSLCHIRAEQGLRPDWLLPPSVAVTFTRAEAAEVPPGTLSHTAVSAVEVSFALEDSFAQAIDDQDNQVNPRAVLSPGDEVQSDGSISGSEDDGDDTVQELLLHRDDQNMAQETHQPPTRPETCDRSMQTSPLHFRAPEVESTSYFVDGFSMSGAIRSGSLPAASVGLQYSVGLQCSLSPDSKDVACSASISLEGNAADSSGLEVSDAAQLQLQDVIAHQLKVKFFFFAALAMPSSDGTNHAISGHRGSQATIRMHR
jgi:hypothetical protein